MKRQPVKGDYVLATKFSDGDPQDHWCVGFYDQPDRDRHLVVDAEGKQFRANGFRRVKIISKQRGQWILDHAEDFAFSRRSMWYFARCKMEQLTK